MAGLTREQQQIARVLVDTCTQIVSDFPFFGRLLLRMSIGMADCQTAYTDQKRIVFDPKFAEELIEDDKLNDCDKLKFVMLHEVLHCVLNHCSRSRGKIGIIYNIACDIVVNSIILEMYGVDEIEIGGSRAMHLAPDGTEGRTHTADELYQKLLENYEEIKDKYPNTIDNHTIWSGLGVDRVIDDKWREYVKSASKGCVTNGLPLMVQRYIEEINNNSKCDWRQLLHDYIQCDESDYSFAHPDKRFSYSDIIMPSFLEDVYGVSVKKLWAAVDTSASISTKALTSAIGEIYSAINQVNLSGWLSFFDTGISKPVPFEDADDLKDVTPFGGGGTSFDVIFDSLDKHFEEDLPAIIVVLTDGYALFPDEEKAQGIPVIWVVIDSDVEPPWGNTVHITSSD